MTMMMTMMDHLSQLGSLMASLMFMAAAFQRFLPVDLLGLFEKYGHKLDNFLNPYVDIVFHEYQTDGYGNKAYPAIERYLSTYSLTKAKRLRANVVKEAKSAVISMDDYEEVTDEFQGIKVWWKSNKKIPERQALFSYDGNEERRYYKLTCHRRHRDTITGAYLSYVLEEGKAIALRTRQRRLYTNNSGDNYYKMWSHVLFEHPATFDTLAMDPKKKEEIVDDLITFSKSKEYYNKIGKAWKRGYLLYGPPGTGKSTMIAAMANLLNYDIYDLELTAVKDNTELRRLMIETSAKSIIVIEDIDCSIDLTGERKGKKDKGKGLVSKIAAREQQEEKTHEVTLSGLLNSVDGLWSACGSERVIVFTTNHVERLDPALVRRGRMDKHIEMSYCCFPAFKVLAKNYLGLESHDLFGTISRLLEEANMAPADVAENLMPKSAEEDAETCLWNLIKALEKVKEKAEEDAKRKPESISIKMSKVYRSMIQKTRKSFSKY